QRGGLLGHPLADVVAPELLQPLDGAAVLQPLHLLLQRGDLRLQQLYAPLLGDHAAVGDDGLGRARHPCGQRATGRDRQDPASHLSPRLRRYLTGAFSRMVFGSKVFAEELRGTWSQCSAISPFSMRYMSKCVVA